MRAKDSSSGAVSDSVGLNATSEAATRTGDADRDFLHTMINRHVGLSDIIHSASDKTDDRDVLEDARLIDGAQEAELTEMGDILERDFKEVYTPEVIAEARQTIERISAESSSTFARTFYRDVVAYHTKGIQIIDEYLPNSRNSEVKQVAKRMKVAHTKELVTLKAKLAKFGG
jgi:uncharacterized protein (DUF305 family)